MNTKLFKYGVLVFLLITNVCMAAEVNVYSARKESLIKPLLKKFTKQTGIKVNLITGKADALIKRMEVEEMNSPADVLITVDAARLYRAKEKNLFQKIDSEYLVKRIPTAYRDTENFWFGLSLRSRVIIYSGDRVKPEQLSTYQDLTNEKWRKKLCVRSSSNIYNQSLVASLISHMGVEKTEQWAKGLVDNFARAPKGGDRDQIKAVAAGLCDLALVNTYYVGGMTDSKLVADQETVRNIKVFWPNQETTGAHVNLSGVGLTRSSKNKEQAIQLIEFLLSDDSQSWYATVNYEYPVVDSVEHSELLKQWGPFKADEMNMELLGKYNRDAVMIMDRVGWN